MSYDHITAAMVLWAESRRIERLCQSLRPYFTTIAIVVQESPDNTLELAQQLGDIVVTDRHHGYGDASFGPVLLPKIRTPWTFKVDGDEMPTEALLRSLGQAVDQAEREKRDGVWIRFRSWTEGVEWTPYHGHLRLFRTELGWPHTLHSRPMTENTFQWDRGWIEHRRSVDEKVRDYLNYWRIGRGNLGWELHNMTMLRAAVSGAAEHKGWDWIKAHDWWPEVQKIAFVDGIPDVHPSE